MSDPLAPRLAPFNHDLLAQQLEQGLAAPATKADIVALSAAWQTAHRRTNRLILLLAWSMFFGVVCAVAALIRTL